MKTIQELAAERFETPVSLKRRALGLRRLVGGLRAETERSRNTGLTDQELRALQGATDIFTTQASRYEGAVVEKRKARDAHGVMEGKVRAAMQANFATLTAIADQVAFIAVNAEHQIKNINTLADLREALKENTDYLVYSLAEQSISRDPQEVVADAWARFQSLRAKLLDKHAATIGRLTTAASVV